MRRIGNRATKLTVRLGIQKMTRYVADQGTGHPQESDLEQLIIHSEEKLSLSQAVVFLSARISLLL
jgi:hypothetical protein